MQLSLFTPPRYRQSGYECYSFNGSIQ
ncbi:hypothetical protein EMIT047CA2_30278 [Pseudomonas soli]